LSNSFTVLEIKARVCMLLRLGEIPPRLGGLKIQNGSHNDLILDTDLSYLGKKISRPLKPKTR
jgi:hypothetical protein